MKPYKIIIRFNYIRSYTFSNAMKKSNFITILFSLFSCFRINLIGQLFGSEVVALLFFPKSRILRLFSLPQIKKIILPYSIFLISLMISDIFVNQTPINSYLRGWSNIIFSFIQVVFLVSLFLKSEKNYILYLFFSAVSFFIFRPQMDGEFDISSNAFKIYFMFGTNYLIILIAYIMKNKSDKLPLLIFFLYAIFCMIADARSNGAVYFLATIIYSTKLFKIKVGITSSVLLLFTILAVGYSGYMYYASKVLSGEVGGSNAQQILKLKNPYNPIELLQEGRRDALFALVPIMDKPLLGFGSWAEDSTGKYNFLYDLYAKNESSKGRTRELIPAHSVLLASWLWAGIGGLIGCFLLYFRIITWGIILFIKTNNKFLIIIIPLLLDLIWNFLFSPIGHIRQTAPIIFAVIIVQYYRFNKKYRENYKKRGVFTSAALR